MTVFGDRRVDLAFLIGFALGVWSSVYRPDPWLALVVSAAGGVAVSTITHKLKCRG